MRENPYYRARAAFRWDIPEKFNIGVDVCDRWAESDPDRPAIIELVDGRPIATSFAALRDRADRIAHLLRDFGLKRGDRVGILAPQRIDTAAAHIAVYKAGAIAVPLFTLFGEDALLHRLSDSGARFLFVEGISLPKIAAIRSRLPQLESVISLDQAAGHAGLDALLRGQPNRFEAVDTLADDPVLIIYTSGTTGASKGALHAHRVLLGHLPGVEMSHGGFPAPGDLMWTPADWAWIGGLLDVLLPSLHHGIAVVAHRFAKFEPEAAYDLIARCGVRNVFLPPTALKLLRLIPQPALRWPLTLRSIASGGESLGAELLSWGRTALNVTINEFYGQTECNMVVSSCDAWFSPPAGSMGRASIGHEVAIVDDRGLSVRRGVHGQIAVRQPNPVAFLGYWGLPDATAQKYVGEWLITGDIGWIDDEDFIYYVARADDVITTAGYRVGPGEIEDCLLRRPEVQSAGVVGIPDPDRTEVVWAFVVTKPGISGTERLAEELQEHVRQSLGAHLYPKVVRFLDALPLTTTGKIVRKDLRRLAEVI